MKDFLKKQIWFVILLTLFSLLLFAIHWYIQFYFFSDIKLIIPLIAVYIFNYLGVLIVFSLINFSYYRGNKQFFILFLGATLVKMILCIVFLLPILLNPNENATLEVLNFFIPYFIYLAFEIVSILSFFKQK